MRIALLQINTTVGDLEGNASLIAEGVLESARQGAGLVITPELSLMGYLPRDLLMNEGFIKEADATLGRLARELVDSPAVLVGTATENPGTTGRPLRNSAVLLAGGDRVAAFHKTLLPTYDVFDEDRYFEPAPGPHVLEWQGRRIGISICEDVWNDRDFWQRPRYPVDPIQNLAAAGAEVIVNLSASPLVAGKQKLREKMLSHMAHKHGRPILYTNLVGGNDDLIFDGRSCAVDAGGKLVARAKGFAEDLLIVDLDPVLAGRIELEQSQPEAEIWQALVLGVRDYARKTGFRSVLLGLSGGIDSALTAAIAAEAMGPENVLGVMMPSPYSSQGSVADSVTLAANLGIRSITIPIEKMMGSFEQALAPAFAGRKADVTEENIQARIRGNLLMALSNKFGSLLLTTGNKSELSVGYCTLYGDMSGGLAVIADLPKMMVYSVSRWRNQRKPDIPAAILTKAPSAELRPDQTDQDSLPPYDILDRILELHIEQNKPSEYIIEQGFERATVERVLRLVKIAEFKRKQAAPGLKVTSRAFGTGWRMPIARKM
ncbi:MAG: NAD+ synthase [Acidobacteriia bacterium]|nr:NAD+ synthase [Terriglobia bacterium]